MSLQAKDKIFLAVGGLALVLTSVWAFVQQSDISALSKPASVPTGGRNYEKTEIKVEMPASQTWQPVGHQPAGEKWIYNVFTPPKIYYNLQTKQFTVVPPEPPDDDGDRPKPPDPVQPFGLVLVKVEQPLFRVQLEGYIGDEGSYRGTFNNVLTGKTFFGVSGKQLPELNLEIVTFEAKRRRIEVPGGSPIIDVTAYAIVKDTVTGQEYRLEPGKRLIDGPLVATFKLLDGTERSIKQGESATVGEATYAVGALTLEPAAAVVTKTATSLKEPVVETLLIPPPAPPPPPAGSGLETEGGLPAPSPFPGF